MRQNPVRKYWRWPTNLENIVQPWTGLITIHSSQLESSTSTWPIILIVIAIIITIIILTPCIGVAFQRPQRSVKHWVFIRNMLRHLWSKDVMVVNYHSELSGCGIIIIIIIIIAKVQQSWSPWARRPCRCQSWWPSPWTLASHSDRSCLSLIVSTINKNVMLIFEMIAYMIAYIIICKIIWFLFKVQCWFLSIWSNVWILQ